MALSARSPDLKHNLQVSNGIYGLIVSIGAVGSVVSLLFLGQLVHKIGILQTLVISATGQYAVMAAIPHIHSAQIYAVSNIFLAMCFSAHMIALHTQVLRRQDESGEILLPRMHGSWSLGVLVTVIAALLITSRISFAWHLDFLMAFTWIATMALLRSMKSNFPERSKDGAAFERITLESLKSIFTFDKSIVVAFAMGLLIELSSGDWSTLVTNQEIGAGKSASVLAYLALIVGMILGRMYIVKLIRYRSERFWIRFAAIGGGGGFIFFSQLAWFLAGKGSSYALTCEVIAFFFAGLGTSFMAPIFTTIANRRSSLKPSEVVSKLNLANTIIAFGAKSIISWLAQTTSITIALLVPGILLMLVAKFAYLGSPNRVGQKGN